MSWRGMVSAAVVVGVLAALTGAVWALRSDEDTPPDALAETPVDYVALGDSYSAGPLIPVVREIAPGCFRSTNNYPAYLAGLLDVDSYTDVDLFGRVHPRRHGHRQPSFLGGTRPRPQAGRAVGATDLVTVGLGGNDFGLFGSISGGCPGDSRGGPRGAPCRDELRLRRGAAGTPRRATPGASGDAAPAASRSCGTALPMPTCMSWATPGCCPRLARAPPPALTVGDAAWARRIEALLNRSVRAAAEDVGATYVDLYPASRDHDICAGRDAWVNGRRLQLGVAPSYHPFEVGMRGMAGAIYEVVTGRSAPDAENASPPPDAVILNRTSG